MADRLRMLLLPSRICAAVAAIILGMAVWAQSALASPEARPCTAENARPSEIINIQIDYAAWRNRCARVRGIAFRDRLYTDREALLETLEVFGENATRSIVIYPEPRLPRHEQAQRVEIVGSIFSCDDHHAIVEARSEPGTIEWVSGYCHTSRATYIRPTTISPLSSAPVLRLTGPEVPPEKRRLVDAPPSLGIQADRLTAAREMLRAVAENDEATYWALTRPDTAHELKALGAGSVPEWILREREEARRELRSERHSFPGGLYPLNGRPERVLIDRQDLEDLEEGNGPAVIVCWCRNKDCAGRWPVLAVDADNHPERPYFCARTSEYMIFRGPTATRVDIRSGPRGLAEPQWPQDDKSGEPSLRE